MSRQNEINFHESPEEFLAAIEYTAAITGFRAELIEKDYYCSAVLSYLYSIDKCPIIFKGGTLLAKVVGDFYRLSEDLDFALPLAASTKRDGRREAIKPIKSLYQKFENAISRLNISENLKGSNESSQYNGELQYESVLNKNRGKIRFEVSLREEIIDPPILQQAKTLLLNPFSGTQVVTHCEVLCFTKKEAYSEKFRAALCRTLPAIRDFYDIYYAIENNLISPDDPDFLSALKKKILLQIKSFEKVSDEKIRTLKQQIETELFPTLRPDDYYKFDLDRVISLLDSLSTQIMNENEKALVMELENQ